MYLFELTIDLFLSGVLEEAEFYNITDLIRLVKEKIKEKHVKMSKVSFFYVLLLGVFKNKYFFLYGRIFFIY